MRVKEGRYIDYWEGSRVAGFGGHDGYMLGVGVDSGRDSTEVEGRVVVAV